MSKKYNCKFIKVLINRRGKNPLQDLRVIKNYYNIIKKESPDLVLAYTVKCDIYGGIICRRLKKPFFPNITGLGTGLANGGVLEKITKLLYKIALKKAKCVFFQNNQDKLFFEKNHINFNKYMILPGSGVNLQKFHPLPYPTGEKVVFTFIGRVMKAKGIEQFLDAAAIIKADYPYTEFHICGLCEENYKDLIAEEERVGNIIYHGLVDDVIEYEKMSSCIILPSFHPEGVSNVLLEAAACGRPVITTNNPGCRETVDDMVSGFLVEEKNVADLVEKIKLFLSMPVEQRREMGLAGRRKMERQFDRKKIVNTYMNAITTICN